MSHRSLHPVPYVTHKRSRPWPVSSELVESSSAPAQVQEGGADLAGEIEEYDYGRFGWFIDPEGNKVELWQPAGGGS